MMAIVINRINMTFCGNVFGQNHDHYTGKKSTSSLFVHIMHTLWSQIEEYTRLLILRKFSTLPAVIWASPFINIQENLKLFCFFTYSNENFSTLPAVIRASPLIKFRKEFQSTLLLEPPLVLETQEYYVFNFGTFGPKVTVHKH